MTALEKSWNRETFAYFMEMGTGKNKGINRQFSYVFMIKAKLMVL